MKPSCSNRGELFCQTGLADAGLADEHRDGSGAGGHFYQNFPQGGNLEVSADKSRSMVSNRAGRHSGGVDEYPPQVRTEELAPPLLCSAVALADSELFLYPSSPNGRIQPDR